MVSLGSDRDHYLKKMYYGYHRFQKLQTTVKDLSVNCHLQKTVGTESEMCQNSIRVDQFNHGLLKIEEKGKKEVLDYLSGATPSK